jgi:hypothetical protein
MPENWAERAFLLRLWSFGYHGTVLGFSAMRGLFPLKISACVKSEKSTPGGWLGVLFAFVL